jgi:hypothetical protein
MDPALNDRGVEIAARDRISPTPVVRNSHNYSAAGAVREADSSFHESSNRVRLAVRLLLEVKLDCFQVSRYGTADDSAQDLLELCTAERHADSFAQVWRLSPLSGFRQTLLKLRAFQRARELVNGCSRRPADPVAELFRPVHDEHGSKYRVPETL